MQKEDKDYEVMLTPLIAHGEDDKTEVVDNSRILNVTGVNVDHYDGFFQIKDKSGAIVFSVPSHFVRFCQVKPRAKVLNVVTDKNKVSNVKGRKRSDSANDDGRKEGK